MVTRKPKPFEDFDPKRKGNKRPTKGRKDYLSIVAGAAKGLKPNQFWVIKIGGKALRQTASKDFTYPVKLICAAMKADWDELQEGGAKLSQIIIRSKAERVALGLQ